MKRSADGSGGAEIGRLRQRIEQWRKTRRTRGPMPAALWAEAIALARKEGLYATARELHVDYGTLKWRLERSPEQKVAPKAATKPAGKPARAPNATVQQTGRPTFVDVAPAFGLSSTSGASVELVRRDGAKLTIRLTAGESLDVVGLVREFWGARS